jgi:hypothetical protein
MVIYTLNGRCDENMFIRGGNSHFKIRLNSKYKIVYIRVS